MGQGDARGMQRLQSLREAAVQTLSFLSPTKNNFMSSSEWTTGSGASCFRIHIYAWTLFFLIFFFLLLIKMNVINLEGKNPPQMWSSSRRVLSRRGAWALCSCSLAECCWSLSFQWKGDRQNQKFCRNYGVLTLELETFISVKKVASTLKSSWAATCSKYAAEGLEKVFWWLC